MFNLSPPPHKDKQFSFNWRNWLNFLYEKVRELDYQFITPTSLNVVAGGTPTGSITDVQTLLDGNVYQLPEVAATPGFDLEFDFENVKSISGIVTMTRYTGLSTHIVTQRLYNYVDAQDDAFILVNHTANNYQYRTILIPDDSKYINASKEAQIIFYHETAGDASHNFYVDYVALLGKSA